MPADIINGGHLPAYANVAKISAYYAVKGRVKSMNGAKFLMVKKMAMGS